MKRTDYINWDEYFMGIALLTAMRSKDPSSQVGACIVSPENKILSLGYNGMPIGCDDDAMPWEREGEPLNTKYMYVCHAELNAILNSAHNNLKGARVYVTLFPCNECTKAIIQSGIAEVVYYSDKYHDTDSSVAARFMFKKAGVRLTPYQPSGRKMELELYDVKFFHSTLIFALDRNFDRCVKCFLLTPPLLCIIIGSAKV